MALPDYLQDSAKDFARPANATSVPINTGTFTGRQFVAGEDLYKQHAIKAATARSWFLSNHFYNKHNN